MQFISKYEGPWADLERTVDINTGEWRVQRPVAKPGKCRKCGWCYIFCPVGCIAETETAFKANLDYCKGCGICARVCPAKAIMLVRE